MKKKLLALAAVLAIPVASASAAIEAADVTTHITTGLGIGETVAIAGLGVTGMFLVISIVKKALRGAK